VIECPGSDVLRPSYTVVTGKCGGSPGGPAA
jgi:hypothetical protein